MFVVYVRLQYITSTLVFVITVIRLLLACMTVILAPFGEQVFTA